MNWLSDAKVEHLRRLGVEPDLSQTRYRIIKEIARGGMGTVYLADDSQLNRQVALKVLNAEADSDLARRMVREAQVIARLEHPGILPIHDVGTTADGRVFYSMKLVRGNRLDEYAATNSSIKDRLRKFQAACEAVAFAHAHGVIHRDLKPQNIMIGAFGEVLVLDWGVAKILPARTSAEFSTEADTLILPGPGPGQPIPASEDDTTHGTVIGTAGYMSPEQARGEIAQLDERSDVYSLGAILYLLLTNHTPIKAGDAEQSAGPTLRPREIDRRISKASQAVCLKAMAQRRGDRYQSARELAAEIAKLLDYEPVSAYRENVFEKAGRWIGRNRFLVLLVLAYLLMRIFFILTAPH